MQGPHSRPPVSQCQALWCRWLVTERCPCGVAEMTAEQCTWPNAVPSKPSPSTTTNSAWHQRQEVVWLSDVEVRMPSEQDMRPPIGITRNRGRSQPEPSLVDVGATCVVCGMGMCVLICARRCNNPHITQHLWLMVLGSCSCVHRSHQCAVRALCIRAPLGRWGISRPIANLIFMAFCCPWFPPGPIHIVHT